MKKYIILAVVLTLLGTSAVSTYAFYCGHSNRNLAKEGMHKYQVLNACGPPVSKEIVGVDKNVESYRIVEEWLYITEYYGAKEMYLLKFDGEGILVEIDWLGKVK
ncbi:MAG: DUF2845 domain-containing protein [Desulfobacteraceae bacterium]|nr:DUF2845 domain-containing protein [Desulfobacteraceae bacterium]